LLHATARAVRGQDIEVWALHVHHGLMPQADAWWRHVQRQCSRWARAGAPVRFAGWKLKGGPAPGDSVEAWARRGRYEALTAMARCLDIGVVLLAHHQRDQAETVLLQALRSAGPAGLSGMPHAIQRDGLWWCRPWLNQPSEAVQAYVRRHRLSHVDDASNRDPRYARSRLRVQAWPVLSQSFPHLEKALVGVAHRMQEAEAVLSELARMDAQGATVEEGALKVKPWMALSPARRALLLRNWARGWSAVGMPESLLTRLRNELPGARTGHRWPAPGGELRLERGGVLAFVPSATRAPKAPSRGG
jgi:tRNA(Ile)-lysidine synthase